MACMQEKWCINFLTPFLLRFYWSLYLHLITRKPSVSEVLTAVAGMFQRLRVREDPIRLGSCSVIKHLLTRCNCLKPYHDISNLLQPSYLPYCCPLCHQWNIYSKKLTSFSISCIVDIILSSVLHFETLLRDFGDKLCLHHFCWTDALRFHL